MSRQQKQLRYPPPFSLSSSRPTQRREGEGEVDNEQQQQRRSTMQQQQQQQQQQQRQQPSSRRSPKRQKSSTTTTSAATASASGGTIFAASLLSSPLLFEELPTSHDDDNSNAATTTTPCIEVVTIPALHERRGLQQQVLPPTQQEQQHSLHDPMMMLCSPNSLWQEQHEQQQQQYHYTANNAFFESAGPVEAMDGNNSNNTNVSNEQRNCQEDHPLDDNLWHYHPATTNTGASNIYSTINDLDHIGIYDDDDDDFQHHDQNHDEITVIDEAYGGAALDDHSYIQQPHLQQHQLLVDEGMIDYDINSRNDGSIFYDFHESTLAATAATNEIDTINTNVSSYITTNGLVAQKSLHHYRPNYQQQNHNRRRKGSSNDNNDINDYDEDDRKQAAVVTTTDKKYGTSVDSNNEEDNVTIIEDTLSYYLTEDVLVKVLNFCSIYDIVHSITLINRYYHRLSYSDYIGWDHYYNNVLLPNKLHVPKTVPTFMNSTTNLSMTSSRENAATSVVDTGLNDRNNLRLLCQYAVIESKRQYITTQELCYDISTRTGTIWSFRFKESAGSDWTSHDPWYNGLPCRKMIFLQDGTMRQVIAASATSTAATTPCPICRSPLCRIDHYRNNDDQANHHDANSDELQFIEPQMKMTWRFLTRPMDLPTRPIGSYVRIQVGGRDVPTYAAMRSPTNNWGFVLESCWGIYASFELPQRIVVGQQEQDQLPPLPPTRDDTLSQQQQQQQQRSSNGNALLTSLSNASAAATTTTTTTVTGSESLNESHGTHGTSATSNMTAASTTATFEIRRRTHGQQQVNQQQHSISPADMQDITMRLTNEVQWREAFLYNVGARILPEGDEAVFEFDQFWQGNNNATTNTDLQF